MAFFSNNVRSYFLSRTSNFIDDKELLVLSDLFDWKNPYFLIPYENYFILT